MTEEERHRGDVRQWHRKSDGDEERKLGNEKGKRESEQQKKRLGTGRKV